VFKNTHHHEEADVTGISREKEARLAGAPGRLAPSMATGTTTTSPTVKFSASNVPPGLEISAYSHSLPIV
jgi:hypothetical protein